MFDRLLSSLKAHQKTTPSEKKVVVLASYLDEGISYIQVTVQPKGSKNISAMSIMTDSHHNSLLKAIECAKDPEVKAYLRSILCELL